MMAKEYALEEWLTTSKKDKGDIHIAECWLKAFVHVLSKENMELYAFEKNHNERCSPANTLDPSGKIEV